MILDTLGSRLSRVTEEAALACKDMIGSGNKYEADRLATEAMRTAFNTISISATIVIGEGERDDAPMLYIGEQVGKGGTEIDIAVDPLEGTNLCAYNHPGAITVLAAGPSGSLLHAPDTYMDKFIVGSAVKKPISLLMSVEERIALLTEAYTCDVRDIHIIVLQRARNQALIDEILTTGAKVKTISDGDVCAGIDALMVNVSGIHALMGIGAAPEGTITAVATKALGGQMSARLMPYDANMQIKNEEVVERMKTMGTSEDTLFTADDLAKGEDLVFSATGVTTGTVLKGITKHAYGYFTETLILRTGNRPLQYVKSLHNIN